MSCGGSILKCAQLSHELFRILKVFIDGCKPHIGHMVRHAQLIHDEITNLVRADGPLPVVLQRYVGEYDARWGRFAAGATLVSLPVMALFYALQRNLIRGLSAGGVKG